MNGKARAERARGAAGSGAPRRHLLQVVEHAAQTILARRASGLVARRGFGPLARRGFGLVAGRQRPLAGGESFVETLKQARNALTLGLGKRKARDQRLGGDRL